MTQKLNSPTTLHRNLFKFRVAEFVVVFGLLVFVIFLSCSLSLQLLAAPPSDDGLKWLFDKYDVSEPMSLIPRENLAGWTAHYGKELTKSRWSVVDGVLICDGSKNNHLAGDLVTKKEYTNFILDFEWINSKGGNSGIKYKLKDFGEIGSAINYTKNFGWLGCEYQILDDPNNREGNGNNGKYAAAALYSVIGAKKNKKLNPHNEINTGRIIVADNHIEHWLNGEKVVEYDLNSEQWKIALSKSKYARATDFGANRTGLIMLQDHGNKIKFSKLIIRELEPKKK
ncbi:MAG: DUF1080 domain-containing protein [Planctomycetaceae bacterium]|jgi:hypothetical protein|nr:DUF1080 domain-containing protein [Planctomycetaceae bacterium]